MKKKLILISGFALINSCLPADAEARKSRIQLQPQVQLNPLM